MNTGTTQELLLKAKNEAKSEIDAERFEVVKNSLKRLYAKKSQAETLVANIDREITDYELEILTK